MTDMKGQIFGFWTVNYTLRKEYQTKCGKTRAYCNCTCICGKTKDVRLDGLLNGSSTNCGCKRQGNRKHGSSRTRLYNIWLGMKHRCYNPHNSEYNAYGGRGIKVCPEWKNDFGVFEKWAMDNNYAGNLTIERIDVNKGYEPSNCKWITRSEQLKNTRRNVFITYQGKTLCANDWCKIYGIPNNVLIHRYRSGLPLEQVFSKTSNRGKSFNNK